LPITNPNLNTTTKMRIELISTGTELLTGKANSDAAFIGDKLSRLGLELYAVTTIADRKADLSEELKRAFERSSVVITTGGLGPTFDDITVETVSECLSIGCHQDEHILQSIREYFQKRAKGEMPKINERQARIIDGAKILENRFGTAPGQMLHFNYERDGKILKKTLFVFPGPPREMQPMFEEYAEPFFKSYASRIRKNNAVRIFGLAESAVEELITPVMSAAGFGISETVDFGILASESVITVKFSVAGDDEMLVDDAMSNIKSELESVLKDNIFGYGADTLEGAVGGLLTRNKKTVSFAESCTGGLIAAKITDIAGSSAYFKSSAVTYSNEAKASVLGVKEETLKEFGAVSAETAKEMAEGVLKFAGADYGVSVTGIAGPDGGSKEKPVGTVYIGIASKKASEAYKYNFIGGRKDIRVRAANTAIDLLRRKILQDTKKQKGVK